jgi:hypothetical protein
MNALTYLTNRTYLTSLAYLVLVCSGLPGSPDLTGSQRCIYWKISSLQKGGGYQLMSLGGEKYEKGEEKKRKM